mmetsp:Transcript_3029/g.6714  ORF Transcript_3029/g.6714 Transcript_3029/m.6714 type:complete len:280 (-) Transcript_3029:646-1485(-)
MGKPFFSIGPAHIRGSLRDLGQYAHTQSLKLVPVFVWMRIKHHLTRYSIVTQSLVVLTTKRTKQNHGIVLPLCWFLLGVLVVSASCHRSAHCICSWQTRSMGVFIMHRSLKTDFGTSFALLFLMALSFCVYFSHCNWASDGVPGWDFVLLLLFLWAMQCARLGLTFPLDRHSLATFSETRNTSGTSSLNRLKTLGIPVKGHQLDCINACLKDIDQLLTPSIINNFINQLFVLRKEWAIISIFEECDAPALRIISRAMKLKTKMINYSVESRKRRRSIGV